MGKSSPPAPQPPDPKETSAASTGTNVATSVANAMLGNVNQVTPDGSLNYSQTGNYSWTDPYTSKTYDVPTFTATQTLSPEQERLRQTGLSTQQNLAETARDQSGFLKDYLAQPVKLDNEAAESRLFELGSKRLDPMYAREEESARARLMNSGIREGSAAWNSEMERFGNQKNDAYNSLMLSGRQQAMQELLSERNQPINEITALMSGSQVSQPNFVPTNMPTIPTTDNAGIINQDYQNRLGAYNSQVQQQQAKSAQMGGLFGSVLGLGGKMLMMSDERTKEDIKQVGETDDGLGVYSYKYIGSDEPQVGLMAQEVEKKNPDAVVEIGGIKHVDYAKAMPALGSLMRA